jgi:glycosyltransferase involved in cell wall biosynthesis
VIASATQAPGVQALPRILMVTGAYFPEISSSGVQCQNIAQQLRGRAEVEVLTTSVDQTLARHDTVDGIPVTRIRVDVRSGLSKLRAFRRMTIDLVRLVRRSDIIHLHGYSSKNVLVTVIAKMFRKSIVMSLHTSGFDEPDAIERQGSLALWAFMSADLYLSVSPGLVETYLAAGLPAERILLVPNGIDIDRFAPPSPSERAALRERFSLPPAAPVIAFVGFFSADKQPRVLFDAWLLLQEQGLSGAILMFVGATRSDYFEVDDTIAPAMVADAERAGVADRLRFIGVTHDVQGYLRAADMYVLPSRREGLPVALLEAMACGLPCVASRLPGSTDAIIDHDRNGLLTPPGDAGELAHHMARVLGDEQLRIRLGAAARDTITRRYSSGNVADRWSEAYALIPALAR